MKRTASAHWSGTLRDGRGELTTNSGALASAPYSFHTRFGEEPGTNPEELLAAAHAGCYTMALTHLLGEAGLRPERVETVAEVTLLMSADGPSVSGVHLRVSVWVPGAAEADVQALAAKAKDVCLVSRLLRVDVSLEARLGVSVGV